MSRNASSTPSQVSQTGFLEAGSYAAALQNPTPTPISSDSGRSASHSALSQRSSTDNFQGHHGAPSTRNRLPSTQDRPAPNQSRARSTQNRPNSNLRSMAAERPNQAHRRENRNISGNREPGNGAFRGAGRVGEVFVGGCLLESTESQLTDFCRENGVTLKKCESLNSKSVWYKSYKISVDFSDRDRILSNEFWPKGIFVRKFYMPRPRTTV